MKCFRAYFTIEFSCSMNVMVFASVLLIQISIWLPGELVSPIKLNSKHIYKIYA